MFDRMGHRKGISQRSYLGSNAVHDSESASISTAMECNVGYVFGKITFCKNIVAVTQHFDL